MGSAGRWDEKGEIIWEQDSGFEHNELWCNVCLNITQKQRENSTCCASTMQSLQIILGMLSVQTNIVIVTGRTKEELLTLASTPKDLKVTSR